MKKVILNEPIRNSAGDIIASETGRVLPAMPGREPQREVKPITFASIANRVIEGMQGVESDEEVKRLDAISKTLVATLKNELPDEIELPDEDFETIKKVIDRQSVVVRARFLEMVESLNETE
jgi:hypothetical protein